MGKFARASWLLAFLIGIGIAVVLGLRTHSPAPTRDVIDASTVLARRTGVCDFKNVLLEEALDQLSARTHCTIHVDWESLDYLWPSPIVSVGFDDLPLSKAINLLLWNATDSADDVSMWEDDGVVYITLYGNAAWRMQPPVTRVYDVHDIVSPGVGGLAVDPPEPPPDTSGGGLFSSGPGKWLPRLPGSYNNRVATLSGLVYLIETLIEPDTWKENGGHVGTIAETAHLLIICQTPANHQQIEHLLARLRDARTANSSNAPPVVGGVDVFPGGTPTYALPGSRPNH